MRKTSKIVEKLVDLIVEKEESLLEEAKNSDISV